MPSWLDQVAGAASLVRDTAREIPGVRWVEAQTQAVERTLLRAAKRHMAELEAGESTADIELELADSQSPATSEQPRFEPDIATPTLAERMRSLLKRSMDNTPDDSRRTLHLALVEELVPDEARILSALADGSAYAMVHIAEPGFSSFQRRVLENVSSVGRAAGVALPDRTHLYVAHLRRLGLVESGPEDSSINDEYEILLTDPLVRTTTSGLGKGPLGARIVRRTVRISVLGTELWEATQTVRGPQMPASP